MMRLTAWPSRVDPPADRDPRPRNPPADPGRHSTTRPGVVVAMILSEADQRAAIAPLRQAARNGELDSDELARRTADVWRCNTPRGLWRATGGRAGRPNDRTQRRSGTRCWRCFPHSSRVRWRRAGDLGHDPLCPRSRAHAAPATRVPPTGDRAGRRGGEHAGRGRSRRRGSTGSVRSASRVLRAEGLISRGRSRGLPLNNTVAGCDAGGQLAGTTHSDYRQ